MPGIPRRVPPDPDRRARTILTQTRGAPSGEGATSSARPVVYKRRVDVFRAFGGKFKPGKVIADPGVSIESTVSDPTSPTIANVNGVAIGETAVAMGDGATAVGSLSTAQGPGAVAVGRDTSAYGDYSVRVGFAGAATATDTVSIGTAASAVAFEDTAIGANAATQGAGGSIAIGPAALAGVEGSSGGTDKCIAIGSSAHAVGPDSIAIGWNSGMFGATAQDAVAIGNNAYAPYENTVALGKNAQAGWPGWIALGTEVNIVVIIGKLVLADSGGGHHEIVVDGSGALSTVPYTP